MTRAWWVLVLVLGGVACKKEAPASMELVRASPDALLASFDATGKELEVVGLVKDIRDAGGLLTVSLETRHASRTVACQADAAQSVAVGRLVQGQLVALQGFARGAQGEDILLDRCRVSWVGPSPRTDPPGDARPCARHVPWRCA
ncbi:OB-fold protein [Melittangium boletus]|uniref:OB-fold protein n=1 Tax=Melittangium boletus TaxID=83453 RepID=UPI003DA30BAD